MKQESQTLPGGTILQGTNGARYIIEDLLGTGGFSAVYRIRDRRSKEIFALKEIINAYDRDRRHMIIEAELLKRQEHSALPKVYQVFEDIRNNRIYLLMDYIAGKDLETLRRERPEQRFSLVMVLALMAPVVDAIRYLHQQQPPIVHRDVKPANIIVPTSAGKPHLVDFGLAKEYTEDKTTNVFRYGTPGYAAPEQYGQGTNLSTDIYGLGATFYTLLTGLVPPDALARTLSSGRGDPLQAANSICPTIPTSVATVLARSMRLNYAERFADIDEFWQALNMASPSHIRPRFPLSTPLPVPVSSVPHTSLASTLDSPDAADTGANRPASKITLAPPITPARMQPAAQIPVHKVLLPILCTALLVGAAIGGALFYRILTYPHPSTARSATTIATTHPTPTPNTSPMLPCSTATPPAATVTTPYPPLASCYMGTIYDIMGKTQTALLLTNIQQKQSSISGDFSGLGYVSPFNGSVATDGEVEFEVILQKLGVTLRFQGMIKLGGDMTGNFDTLASSTHENNGESGEWYLCAPADSLCYPGTPQPTSTPGS